jgi:hypothetical protein
MATLESKVSVCNDVLFRELAGEAVLLNLATGKYYGLDEVGTRMWILLTQYGSVKPACCALLDEYDVTEDRLRQDLLHLVDELADHKLLQIDDA